MNKIAKKILIGVGIAGGCSVVVGMTAAVLNSRRMKMLRAYRRAGNILYRVGTVLQTVSEVM